MGRTIVITGASSGIGRALAMEYAGKGTTLGLLGRDTQRLEAVAAACRQLGATVHTGSIDVHDAGAMVGWLQAFDAGHAVDLLIASAGIVSGTSPGQHAESLADGLRVIDVNLKGAMTTVSALADRMRTRRSGHLVLVSSLAGLAPQPDLPSYSASKAGLVAYGAALRARLRRDGVAVSVVCPGYVESPLLRRQRSAKPFTWSAQQAARYIRSRLDKRRRLIAFPWQLALGIRLLPLAPTFLQDWILGGFKAEVIPDGEAQETDDGKPGSQRR
jgi:short-subunit dehydrogenase